MAQMGSHWIQLVLELAEEIENSGRALFALDDVFAEVSRVIQDALRFDFVAIQLLNKEDRTIQTVHATGSQAGLVGLAKHSIDGDDGLLDIQASVFNATPPKIKLISGWESHFDKLLYEQFDHARVVRAWTPILVLKDKDGNILPDWSHVEPWGELLIRDQYIEAIDGQHVPRYNADIVLDLAKIEGAYGGPVTIDAIGTIEAGHHRLMEGMTRGTAVCLAEIVTQLAVSRAPKSLLRASLSGALPSLREMSLDNVLEVTAKSAVRMLDGVAATLHFYYDEVRKEYLYNVASGAVGPQFLAAYRPRKTGLGRQAIKEQRPLVVPDLAAGQDRDHLATTNPGAWALGFRTIAAFPLFVGDKYGVLYVAFRTPRRLTSDELAVIDRFLSRAAHAIRSSTYHKDSLDENRRLTNLNLIAQSLVSQQNDPSLLSKIGGNAVNLLAADVVTMHEYAASENTFLDTAVAGHWCDPHFDNIVDQHRSAARLIQEGARGIVDQSFEENANVFDFPDGVRASLSSEHFVRRLGIVLEYAEEIFGVMFIYYRRQPDLSRQDMKAFEVIAAHAALAMRIRRSYRNIQATLERREKELSALRAIDQQIFDNPGDPGTVHRLVLHNALDILGAESGAILIYDRWSNKLEVKTSQSYPTDATFLQVHLTQGVVGEAVKKRGPCLVEDILEQPWVTIYGNIAPVARSEMAVPLLDDTGLLGVLNVQRNHPVAISESDKSLLKILAVQATMAIHIVSLVQGLDHKISTMRALSFVVSAIAGTNDRESIMMAFLTGITSGHGLGVGRAILFLVESPREVLSGKMAVGPLRKDEADRTWNRLRCKERELERQGKEVLDWYIEQAQSHSRGLQDGSTQPPPLFAAISNTTIPMKVDCALTECLQTRRPVIVSHEQEDTLREIMEEATGEGHHYHAFACVPLIAGSHVLGALFVDNRFLPNECDSSFDTDGLMAYAGALAIAIDNSRLQREVALTAVMKEMAELGHRLKHPLSEAKSAADSLGDRIYDSPYISDIFWNSEAGELFTKLRASIHGGLRMARELKAYRHYSHSSDIDPHCNLNMHLKTWIHTCAKVLRHNIDLHVCEEQVYVSINTRLVYRAVRELLVNADSVLHEADVGEPLISVFLSAGASPTDGNGQARITISDNGPGVEEYLRAKIFEPLFTTRRERGGTGLGLFFVEQFVKEQNGSVGLVESGSDGATFVISLPRVPDGTTLTPGPRQRR